MRPGYEALSFAIPTHWIAHQGVVAHLSGSTSDLLVFDYPLTGTYEMSALGYVGPNSASQLAHNGLAIVPAVSYGGARINPLGGSEVVNIPWGFSRGEGFNRLTVQASSQKTRYLVNGHLLYEDDDPSPTSPWLGLLTSNERYSAWREVTITGRPVIPREVNLVHADRLEGWISSFFGETQPPRRTEERTDEWGNVMRVTATGATIVRTPSSTIRRVTKKNRQPVKVNDFDWAAEDGVIHGRRVFAAENNPNVIRSVDSLESATEAAQSRLYYHRPLRNGDILTYEFFYQPGQVMVHPAIDRLAFLLEPEGVRLHWMTAGSSDLSGLAADNVADEPENRRGPKSLPLKPGQWNAVKITLDQSKLTIALEGQPIYERNLEPHLGRQFGLFHYKDQSKAQVRNVVLRGRWPASLPPDMFAGLVAEPAGSTDPARAARHAAIGEPVFALEAGEVVERAAQAQPRRSLRTTRRLGIPHARPSALTARGGF